MTRTKTVEIQRNLISITRKIIDSIRDGLELEEVFISVVKGTRELMAYSHLYLSVILPNRHSMKVLFSNGVEPNLLSANTTIPLSQPGADTPFLEHYPTIIDDLSKQAKPDRIFGQFFSSGIRAAIVIPLITKDHLLGNLVLGSLQPNAFGGRELEVMQAIADQLAVAVEKASLFASEREQHERLRLINQTGRILLSSLDLKTILSKIGRFVQSRFSYYHLSIWLLNRSQDALVLTAHSGGYTSAIPLGYELPIGSGIVGHVIRNRRSYYSPNINKEASYIPVERFDLLSELAVPITFRDDILGVINLESNSIDAFDDSDLTLMETIADQLAAAIVNSRLYEQLSDFNQKLQHEISIKTAELENAKALLQKHTDSLEQENQQLKDRLAKEEGLPVFIGQSESIKSLLSLVERIAPSDASILIEGESGTGKELIARLIHCRSLRARAPFVAINCGTLSRDLLESELFGHEKGAFTGAIERKIGLVESANGGTLFLDEVSELDGSIQSKLLRFLQEREFYRVGGKTVQRTDIRLLCATNKPLQIETQSGGFREDLYYRLNTISVDLPPLRQRTEDLPLLLKHFLDLYRGAKQFTLSRELIHCLETYAWPGNVREFEGLIQRLCILCDPGEIDVENLPSHIAQPAASAEVPMLPVSGQSLKEVERILITETLKAANGKKELAAKQLGISLKTLYNKIHRYQIAI